MMDYTCMLLFDQSIEQSLHIHDLYLYIHADKFCTSYYVDYLFSKICPILINSMYVRVYLFLTVYSSCKRPNDRMTFDFGYRVGLDCLLFCVYLNLKRGKRTVADETHELCFIEVLFISCHVYLCYLLFRSFISDLSSLFLARLHFLFK